MQKDFFDKPWLRDRIGRAFRFLPPNAWTTISLVLAVGGFVGMVLGRLWLGLGVFLASTACDFIDGKVARYTGTSSTLGAWWDGLVDRFVDALLIMSFFFLEFPCSDRALSLILFSLLFFTLLPPFIVAYANHRGAVPDPSERVIWRFAFRFEYILLLGISAFLQAFSMNWSFGFLWATLILMAATTIQSTILVFAKSRDYD